MPPSFNIKATNIVLTPDLRDYVERRFQSVAGVIDFADPTLKVQVEIGRTTRHHDKGDVYRAEFNVRRAGTLARAAREAFDIRAAIDEARDALERELARAKGRSLSLVRRSSRAVKEFVRGWYGAGMKYVHIPKFRLPAVKIPRLRLKFPDIHWRFWRRRK